MSCFRRCPRRMESRPLVHPLPAFCFGFFPRLAGPLSFRHIQLLKHLLALIGHKITKKSFKMQLRPLKLIYYFNRSFKSYSFLPKLTQKGSVSEILMASAQLSRQKKGKQKKVGLTDHSELGLRKKLIVYCGCVPPSVKNI